MIVKLKRTPGLYLVGFMASGKTTIGRSLADELGWNFVDTDDEIEANVGASICEIFDTRGEEEFRKVETEVIRKRVRMVERGRPTVMALGGGAFAQQGNFELIENNGVTVWLDCPFALVEERVRGASHRPLARDLEKLQALYEMRRPAYSRADFRIEIKGDDPAPVVAGILHLPIF
jgi:shikimate kinase